MFNRDAATRFIRHEDLTLYSEDSPYRAVCPACTEGILLVSRDQKTLRIQREDRCTRCCQRVFYLDDRIGGEMLPPIRRLPLAR